MTDLSNKTNRWAVFRQALAGHDEDYTRLPIRRALALLAIPMMLEMTMESIFAIVDIFFVAGLGPEAVTAVGLTEAVVTVIYAVSIGVSTSATAMVARRMGERDPEAASVVAGQAMWVGAAVALVISFVGILFAADILALMGADADVIADGAGYTTVLLGGSITILFLFLLNAVFRGTGDANLAMRVLWISNGINIVLDPLLIYGLGPFPELGVTGAAVATTIGRGIGVIYQLYILFGAGCRIRLGLHHLRLAPPVLAMLLRISIGGVLQHVIATSSWIFLVRIVSLYGSAAVAGYTIALRLFEFTFLPGWGLGNATATLVGQNLGAGDPGRAERSVWQAARYNAVFLGTVSVIFIIFAESLIALFIQDSEVIRYGADALRFLSYGYALFAIWMVVTQGLNGAGDTETPTLLNLVAYWIIQLPLAYTLAQSAGLGPRGAWLAVLVAESVLAVSSIFAFRLGRWKVKRV